MRKAREYTQPMATGALAAWLRDLQPVAATESVDAPYRSYAETWRLLAALVNRAPGWARVEQVGESVLGQPIWSVWVDPASSPADVSTTFVVAGIHAMEHVGVATAVALVERAVAPASPWQRERLVVIPMANPDGFMAVEAGLAAGRRRFWRSNQRGVDLNRNFAVGWDDRYFWNRVVAPIFSPGASPLSEPESQAVDRTVQAARPRYALSLHAFGEWIFTPYAGQRRAPADHDRLIELGHQMAAAQPYRPYRVMQLAQRSRLFQARGAEIDHFYERYGALSFLIEIGAGPRLSHPRTWTVPYRWFTPPAELLERDVGNVVPAIEFLAST